MSDDIDPFMAEFARRVQDKMDLFYIEEGADPVERDDDGLNDAFIHVTAGVLSYLSYAADEVGMGQAFVDLMNAITAGWTAS